MALLTVLVVNAGSTGLKLSVVGKHGLSIPVSPGQLPEVAAVGHRIVHGGQRFNEPIVIDQQVEYQLERLVELAPLHNAPALDALREVRKELPAVPHVAVFDTAFHRTIPAVATTYALPRRYRELGIRRYGFHGLSVQWASERVDVRRLVVCHLGGGCSVTAVGGGRSLDTTMGFTPLEGVPMATRAGSVDPGALVHLLRSGVTVDQLDQALESESGLLGLSGQTGDVAELSRDRSPAAAFALEVFCYRIAQAVAAMTATLGGLDALAFTGGVGEHSAMVRSAVCERLGFLGVLVDEDTNAAAAADASIEARESSARVEVIRSREDLVIARAVRHALGS